MSDPIRLRASSLPELFDCPARWKAKHIDGMRSPSGGAAALGTALHASTGVFDDSRIKGMGLTVSDAVDALVDKIRKPEYEVRWEDITAAQAIDRGALLTRAYCEDIAPLREYEAVELQCESLVLTFDNGVKIEVTGTADRIRTEDGKRGISDLKSGKRVISRGIVDVDKHTAQLGAYELTELLVKQTTQQEMTLDAEIVALPTQGPPEPATATIRRPSRVLLGDEKHVGLLDTAAQMFKAGTFFGNPRSMLCSETYCPAYSKCWWRASGGQ